MLFLALGGRPDAMDEVADLLDPLANLEPVDPETAAELDFERFSSFAARHNTAFRTSTEQPNAPPKRTKVAKDALDIDFLDG